MYGLLCSSRGTAPPKMMMMMMIRLRGDVHFILYNSQTHVVLAPVTADRNLACAKHLASVRSRSCHSLPARRAPPCEGKEACELASTTKKEMGCCLRWCRADPVGDGGAMVTIDDGACLRTVQCTYSARKCCSPQCYSLSVW
jgi:hypothetical protein